MSEVEGAGPAVDLQYHELARVAAHDEQAAGDGPVHLHDARDIVLIDL